MNTIRKLRSGGREMTIELGKIAYLTPRRDSMADVTIRWDGRRFSASAGIWNRLHTDYLTCGQIVDSVCARFPGNPKAQKVLALWREWHLNDMLPGSPAQMAALNEHGGPFSYDGACAFLREKGLQPDPSYIINGKPYSYGSAWLGKEIPPDVVAEIESLFEEG